MRAKRSAILASLLVSMLASLWLGTAALSGPESGDVVYADERTNNRVADPALVNDPKAEADVETRSGSLTGFFVSIGALLAFAVFLVSTILFRGEVRSEKLANRARKQRLDYMKDLRRYNEQLKGPPRDNT